MNGELKIAAIPPTERKELVPILEKSFEGWYLWHSKRTLKGIGLVLSAVVGDSAVGLAMLKEIGEGIGYIYYLAVLPEFRKRGIGGTLMDEALAHFASQSTFSVYASVEEDNVPSLSLLRSKGFQMTGFDEMSQLHGLLPVVRMMFRMETVSGEVVLRKDIDRASIRHD